MTDQEELEALLKEIDGYDESAEIERNYIDACEAGNGPHSAPDNEEPF